MEENLANKHDIELIRRDMKEMETALRRDMKEMEARLEARMAGMEGRLEAKFVGLEAKFIGLEARIAEMETRLLVRLGAIFIGGITILGVLLGVLVALVKL